MKILGCKVTSNVANIASDCINGAFLINIEKLNWVGATHKSLLEDGNIKFTALWINAHFGQWYKKRLGSTAVPYIGHPQLVC